MKCVAVPKAGGIEGSTVIVNGASAVDDFVFTVAIDVGHINAVRSLTDIIDVDVVVDVPGRLKMPNERQLAIAKVIGRNFIARLPTGTLRTVIPPRHNQAGPRTVEVRHGRGESVHSITVTVTPLSDRTACRLEGDGRPIRAGEAIENGQVFRAGEDVAAAVPVVGSDRVAAHEHRIPSAVDGAGGGFHGNFGFAVA